ncbi:hypothetical protein CALCODRAFT_488847 [Calocera cornea HHB12733]|uniref:Uncharacterized protein n=1 Tax=Calocera cornea HHB12733 TaxID=1353952 RepID=A0A165C583_9BASI|nr:hypothetical protein CALCODRAFT_488847 [Calocera cornea HHB12733]
MIIDDQELPPVPGAPSTSAAPAPPADIPHYAPPTYEDALAQSGPTDKPRTSSGKEHARDFPPPPQRLPSQSGKQGGSSRAVSGSYPPSTSYPPIAQAGPSSPTASGSGTSGSALDAVTNTLGNVLNAVGNYYETKHAYQHDRRQRRWEAKAARVDALWAGLTGKPASPPAPYAPYGGQPMGYGPYGQPQPYPPMSPPQGQHPPYPSMSPPQQGGQGMFAPLMGPPPPGPGTMETPRGSRDPRVPQPYNVVGNNPPRLAKGPGGPRV